MKLALSLNVIDPHVGGVLIRGDPGTGKSTAARALAKLLPAQRVVVSCPFGCDPDDLRQMCDDCRARSSTPNATFDVTTRPMRVVELPVNASVDRVVGGIDLEAALRHGATRFTPGVLAAANRNILYVDEVNLINDQVVDVLLDVVASGVNIVEREGISVAHPAQIVLIATMNPQEGELRPQLLDRFGLCVDVTGSIDAGARAEIAERDARFRSRDPAFDAEFERGDQELAAALAAAQAARHRVTVSNPVARLISEVCAEASAIGHRADVVTRHGACALAALRGRLRPRPDDVYDVAELALAHRGRRRVERPVPIPDNGGDERPENEPQPGNAQTNPLGGSESPSQAQPAPGSESGASHAEGAGTGAGQNDGTNESGGTSGDEPSTQVVTMPTGQRPDVPLRLELPRTRGPRRQSGKRILSEAVDRRGRYVRSRPQEPMTDLAVDATLRAAAPNQVQRGWRVGEPLILRREDLRQKIREHKVGSLVIFVVDGSGSMDADKRMATTKALILALLRDAYVRRDRVAAIVFRHRTANTVLQPTSSVSLAERQLAEMSVGGRTPLAHGLLAGYHLARREQRLDPTVRPLIVLISDGRSNVALGSGDPVAETHEVANQIRRDGIDSLVVDPSPRAARSSSTPMYEDLTPSRCVEIAEWMGAVYLPASDHATAELGRVITRIGRRPVAAA